MKLSIAILLSLTGNVVTAESHDHDHGDDDCTHGKLYVLDDASSNVHVIVVSKGKLEDLTVETTVALPSVVRENLSTTVRLATPSLCSTVGQNPSTTGGFA